MFSRTNRKRLLKMADLAELSTNLATHKLQLQQVETALTTEPENGDLLKLKDDLQSVIELTQDLIQQHTGSSADQEGDAHLLTGAEGEGQKVKDWSTGDKCLAPWSNDGQYYDAKVDEIVDGSCTVTFDGYNQTEVTTVDRLKPADSDVKRPESFAHRKGKIVADRDYKRKKQQKKAQRMKQLEEEKEADKKKWKSFNSKMFSKTSKGRVRKSIFATPDGTSKGKVGVGTCGVSGKPMTDFKFAAKYMKGQ